MSETKLTQAQKDALIVLEAVGGTVIPGDVADEHWQALLSLVDLNDETRLVSHGWHENEKGTLIAQVSLTELGMRKAVSLSDRGPPQEVTESDNG